MLLAEANQWPEDVRDYFGDGDECHMAYHFPLMPRMYMAIAQEDRHPIVEIMDQTPDIPDTCQWAVFLRNHDELTLEMVTSRERDYMYQAYAADTRARLNLGIRRRLAPLMENDPERIKLMNSLLLSMSGSPIIYYGDEIGMGDNFYLGDRNGVRTPMQWSPDRNAGFSRADPQQLYLPPIMDPIYGYEAVNVEAQTRDRSSLLNWMRRMLAVRKTSQAFGRGTLRFIRPGNRKVLVYLRQYADDTILCVANLSRSAQPVEIDLAEHKGAIPIELLGRTPFPPVGELPYLLTLPAYGFYWFRLSREAAPPPWHDERLTREDLPVLVLVEGWNSFFPDKVAAWRAGLARRLRTQLEERIVPQYIAAQRWFASKGAPITSARLLDHTERQDPLPRWFAGIYSVESQGTSERYFVPLAIAFEDTEEARWRKLQPSALARVRQQATVGVLADACGDDGFARATIDAIGASAELPTQNGRVRFTPTALYPELRGDPAAELPVNPTGAQSSNTTLRVGDGLFLKVYRKLQPGLNPELEIGRYLTEVAHFPNIVPVAGAAEYIDQESVTYTVALLQAFVTNQGDGWDYTLDYLARFLEDRRSGVPMVDDAHGLYLSHDEDARHPHGGIASRPRQADGRSRLCAGADCRRGRGGVGRSHARRRGGHPDAAVEPVAAAVGGGRRGRAGPARTARDPDAAHRCLHGDRASRPQDPAPRRLSPRPGAAEAQRLHNRGLRGGARPHARGAPPQALPADRRCRHAALLRLCASCRARARRAAGEAMITAAGRRCCRRGSRRRAGRSSPPTTRSRARPASTSRCRSRGRCSPLRDRQGALRGALRAREPAGLDPHSPPEPARLTE